MFTSQIYGKLSTAKPGSADKWKGDGIDALRREFPRNLRVAYVDTKKDPDTQKDVVFSCLVGVDPVSGEDRKLFKVKLPGNPILGEGKPENQNQAVIFTRGEHLQTLDMNQDNYMGESYKMRNLLECFSGHVRKRCTIVPNTYSFDAAKLATAPPLSEKMCSRKPTMRTRPRKHSSRLRILNDSPM